MKRAMLMLIKDIIWLLTWIIIASIAGGILIVMLNDVTQPF